MRADCLNAELAAKRWHDGIGTPQRLRFPLADLGEGLEYFPSMAGNKVSYGVKLET